MTNKDIFDDVFPQNRQIGGDHYKDMAIQPFEFISKNELTFFQGNVVKYVCRYKRKNGIQDLKQRISVYITKMLKIINLLIRIIF